MQEVPLCPHCAAKGKEGVMKPDIVFFGEGLRESFHRQIQEDKDKVVAAVIVVWCTVVLSSQSCQCRWTC